MAPAISTAASGYSLTLRVRYSPARRPCSYTTSVAADACSPTRFAKSCAVAGAARIPLSPTLAPGPVPLFPKPLDGNPPPAEPPSRELSSLIKDDLFDFHANV